MWLGQRVNRLVFWLIILFLSVLLLLALGLSLPVIAGEVAVLAEALRVVQFLGVLAGPGLLRAAIAVVATHAHIFGVVASVRVWAGNDFRYLSLTSIEYLEVGLSQYLVTQEGLLLKWCQLVGVLIQLDALVHLQLWQPPGHPLGLLSDESRRCSCSLSSCLSLDTFILLPTRLLDLFGHDTPHLEEVLVGPGLLLTERAEDLAL